MLKLVSARVEARTGSTTTSSVERLANSNKAYDGRPAPENIANLPQRAVAALTLAEHRVPEINALVDFQRSLVKELADAGKDTTSAEIMLDSLLLSLFLAAEERHRLRALVNMESD